LSARPEDERPQPINPSIKTTALRYTTVTMKASIFAASLLASAAIAHQHPHARRHHHNKRQDNVVWVTDIDYITEIVGLTTTIWVSSQAQVTVSPTGHAKPATTVTAGAPQFFQGSSSTSVAAPQPTEATSSAAAAAAPAPVESSSSSLPAAETPVASTPAPAPTTLATSTTPAAAPAPAATSASSSSSSSSSGGQCSQGSPCTGDITYYDTGLGACGITSTNTDKVVALPHGLMGAQSNGNPYCGRTISITCEATGKTATATVVDKCMGCDNYSIDLSPGVFDELDSESVGRTTATWYFTD
jgi:hypothetical protein